jgi:hypothetical protein
MRNLAGNADCDVFIRDELARAGIPLVEFETPIRGEVPARFSGKLGPFTFERAWYYWIVKGPMPLSVARELYEHHVGRTDVRVGGHCGCPSPDRYGATHFDGEGRRLARTTQQEQYQQLVKNGFVPQSELDKYRFVDDPAAVAAFSIVDSYHIDSAEGLRLFADTIRTHGLDKEWRGVS